MPIKQNSKIWSQQELQLLTDLKKQYPDKKWKKISNYFSIKGFNRSDYECREKWVNFLDPKITRQTWKYQELEILFSQYNQHNSKWSIIQESLRNRTQTKIKNKFYSTIRNILRFLYKFFKNNEETHQIDTINNIYPHTLKTIYEGKSNFDFIGTQIKNLIKQMNYNFNKRIMTKKINESKQLYYKIYENVFKNKQITVQPHNFINIEHQINQNRDELNQHNWNFVSQTSQNQVLPIFPMLNISNGLCQLRNAQNQLQNPQLLRLYCNMFMFQNQNYLK